MRSTVLVATTASRVIMGQQAYEKNLLASLVALDPWDIDVEDCSLSSMRGRHPGAIRLPMKAIARSPIAARAAARWAYRGADLVHRCDLRLPGATGRGLEVVTVHDLAFEHFSDEGSVPDDARQELKRAQVVIAPSEFSAQELRTRWGLSDVRTVPNGVDPRLLVECTQGPGYLGQYVLHSGGASTRKNLGELAAAWGTLRRRFPGLSLLMTGPADPRREAAFGHLAGVTMLGHVERSRHLQLLLQASVVVVPSLYEGFGLPVLEALAARVPVVVSNCSSLPEVAGGHGVLVEPTSAGLLEGLTKCLNEPPGEDEREAGRAWARNFTWESSARKHLAIYREVLSR